MKNILNSIWNDFKMPFSKTGRASIRKNNQNLHFGYTLPICIALTSIFVFFNQFMVQGNDPYADFIFGVFISGAIGWVINAAREQYLDVQYKKRTGDEYGIFDWRDVRFGWYAGLVAGILVMSILQTIF